MEKLPILAHQLIPFFSEFYEVRRRFVLEKTVQIFVSMTMFFTCQNGRWECKGTLWQAEMLAVNHSLSQ